MDRDRNTSPSHRRSTARYFFVKCPISFLLLAIVVMNASTMVQAQNEAQTNADNLQMLSTSIATGNGGNVYFLNTSQNLVYEVSQGSQIPVNCCAGLAINKFNRPRAIAADQEGNLYVADTGNNRVVKINATGQPSVVNTANYQFSNPSGVAVDKNGDLYVADTGNNRVVKINAPGQPSVVNIASYQLSKPSGIAVDQNGNLYIADTGNNRIIKVTPSGTPELLLGGQLNQPFSIVPDNAGSAYISQAGSASSQISTQGGDAPSIVASFSSTDIVLQQGQGPQSPVTSFTITLTPHGGFNQTLTLSFLGLPPNTAGIFSPPTVTFDGDTPVVETMSLGIVGTGQSIYLTKNESPTRFASKSHGYIAVAGLVPFSLLLLIGLRKPPKAWENSRRITGFFVLLLLLPATISMTAGCSGGIPGGSANNSYTSTLVARTLNGNTIYQLGSIQISVQ